jgi:hypothetical protein
MKDLRALLIDCRIELRKLSREFQKSELCDRLDVAIQAVAAGTVALPGEPPPAEAVQPTLSEKGQTASQVALAWQTAARDLKFSDPAIHARLGERVMRLLGTKTLVDPATEILQLQGQLDALKKQLAERDKAVQAIEVERDAVMGALANAVPALSDGGDRLGVALARVQWLVAELQKAPTARPGGPVRSTAPDPNDLVPTPERLAAVAAGGVAFTKEQREWSVGEAMVLSGFQYTPVELIAQGDAAIARLIVDARKGA